MALELEDVADESVLCTVFEWLGERCLGQAMRCNSRFASAGRADILWLGLTEQRWRFGSETGDNQTPLAPGLREQAARQAEADARRDGANAGQALQLYSRRRAIDDEVAQLVAQFCISDRASSSRWSRDAEDEDASKGQLSRGCVVSFASAAGSRCVGVVRSVAAAADGDVELILVPSLRPMSRPRDGVSVIGRAVTKESVFEQLYSMDAEAIDELVRIVGVGSAAPDGVAGRELVHDIFRRAAQSFLRELTCRWAVKQWKHLVTDPGRADLLEEGALVVSQWSEPAGADVKAVRARLAELADEVSDRISPNAPLRERVDAVSAVLFEVHNFCGNSDDYYDPRNSFLHHVLRRGRGIPISLSIVWTVVARRLQVPCHLCSDMPAHIIVRVNTGFGYQDDIYVDAFNQKVMDWAGLSRFTTSLGVGPAMEQFVVQRPATAVYGRLLRNLRNIYKEAANAAPSVSALEYLRGTCAQTIAIEDGSPAGQHEVRVLQGMSDQISAKLVECLLTYELDPSTP